MLSNTQPYLGVQGVLKLRNSRFFFFFFTSCNSKYLCSEKNCRLQIKIKIRIKDKCDFLFTQRLYFKTNIYNCFNKFANTHEFSFHNSNYTISTIYLGFCVFFFFFVVNNYNTSWDCITINRWRISHDFPGWCWKCLKTQKLKVCTDILR